MHPYTWLVSSFLFPLHERLKGHRSVARRVELEASQWWSPETLEAYRLERLRCFLAHVWKNVPYYNALFREIDFRPEELSSLGELERIPFLTKSIVRKHFDDLKSTIAGSLKRYNTGGSSGEPLIFLIGKDRITHDVAAKWRATRWWGVDIGDPEIVVWGSPIEIGAQDRLRALRDRLLRSYLLPAFEMSETNLDRYVEAIRRIRPKMLFGYPSALAHIARHARATGRPMNDLGVQVAFVTGERLYDDQRETIAMTFGCRVANGYGGRDAGFIAHECPHGRMHISAEDLIVEIVGEDGRALEPGSPGEIVITHLATADFPFIRYRTGDMGVIDPHACLCGRGLPVLKEIHGRSTDFVVAADGTVMHGLSLIYVLRDVPGLKQFKIVQESLDKTRVLVVPDDGFDKAELPRIESGLAARLGQGVTIDIECVERIPPEASGKHRYVVSHVAGVSERSLTRSPGAAEVHR